ncbi:hypothetical protein BCR34DRAFT_481583 [Clohesyomyces aquaticus]|uniref:Fungal N-terminal domain-containing protein n=1 Tax=Clohesyomyces aquaticus TaxID=1231657 RepID=A0A1Y1ZTH5_9PLEO|nr:hypothetical protein BCR34DRAFT_481583 [Clohesyomyces aquaticus]
MEPVSAAASVIAILQLTSKVIEYLDNVRRAQNDRARLAIEASNLYNLLTILRYRLGEGRSNKAWYTVIRSLGVPGGPLDQYKHTLEQLRRKLQSRSGTNNMGQALLWRFNKEEVTGFLSRMESLKNLIPIGLEMDHL